MVTISEWLVGAFFGALITSFLWMAGLTALARYSKKIKEREDL